MKSDKTSTINNKAAKKVITRNYNGEELKPGEVLVPIMYDAAFVKKNCTNPECIKSIHKGGRCFKVMYMAVPEELAPLKLSSSNLELNELLGHDFVPNSVSMEQMSDEYDFNLGSVPSPEDEMIARETKQETGELFSDLIHHLIVRSPKHDLAALLLLNGSKGAKFQEEVHLGHDAANTVRKQAEGYLKVGLANINIDEIQSKKSKHTDYYREEAYRLLDALMAMYNE